MTPVCNGLPDRFLDGRSVSPHVWTIGRLGMLRFSTRLLRRIPPSEAGARTLQPPKEVALAHRRRR